MFVKIGGVWYLYHYKGEATDQLTIELSEAFEIWPNAFVGAEIKAVRLDSNVTKIHGNAFAGVSGLSTFYYEGTDVAFANVLQGTSLSGNKYYQYYNGCVHGTKPNQWGDHGNGIFYTPCALEWFEEVKATCESEGLKVERCACGCDYKSGKTELIPKKAHEFVDGVCDCGLVKEQLTDENLEQWQTAGVIALDGFAVEGGKFSATNLGDEGNSTVATFTITAKQDMKVTFAYAVHSEVNGDKLIVDVNGEKFEVSGDDGKSLEFVLEADQTITFTYQKKESASVEGECACVQDIYFIYYNN